MSPCSGNSFKFGEESVSATDSTMTLKLLGIDNVFVLEMGGKIILRKPIYVIVVVSQGCINLELCLLPEPGGFLRPHVPCAPEVTRNTRDFAVCTSESSRQPSLMSVIFRPAILGPGRLGCFGSFSSKTPMPIKFFLLGGGGFWSFEKGEEVPILF